jgi:ketosteroid isomerase-like protein
MYSYLHPRLLVLGVLVLSMFGQTKSPGVVSKVSSAREATAARDAAAEVLAFERAMEAAVVRGDVAYVERVSAPDLTFTHGDGWTTGGKPLMVDDREAFLKRVQNRQYNARDLDSVHVEMHGDIAITYGRYVAQNRTGNPNQSWFSVWFERVYAKRNGHWLYVSHRTVHGPTYGPDRQSVSDK